MKTILDKLKARGKSLLVEKMLRTNTALKHHLMAEGILSAYI